nr:MAG TPA: 4Fe-4S dicluster domain protein [Caudoviricetes sp.]
MLVDVFLIVLLKSVEMLVMCISFDGIIMYLWFIIVKNKKYIFLIKCTNCSYCVDF